jgi:hypothetical protein
MWENSQLSLLEIPLRTNVKGKIIHAWESKNQNAPFWYVTMFIIKIKYLVLIYDHSSLIFLEKVK